MAKLPGGQGELTGEFHRRADVIAARRLREDDRRLRA
jgi:hypothetical protein